MTYFDIVVADIHELPQNTDLQCSALRSKQSNVLPSLDDVVIKRNNFKKIIQKQKIDTGFTVPFNYDISFSILMCWVDARKSPSTAQQLLMMKNNI